MVKEGKWLSTAAIAADQYYLCIFAGFRCLCSSAGPATELQCCLATANVLAPGNFIFLCALGAYFAVLAST
jgi:hypothetical protein